MERVNHFSCELSQILGNENWNNIQLLVVIYSRFEYVLEKLGFLINIRGKYIIDWYPYIEDISDRFQINHLSNQTLLTAYEYLLRNPPKKKILGIPSQWQTISFPRNVTDCKKVIEYIRAIRNNLFHGSKYPFDTARDSNLILSSIILLDYCIEISSNDFLSYFWEGLSPYEDHTVQ